MYVPFFFLPYRNEEIYNTVSSPLLLHNYHIVLRQTCNLGEKLQNHISSKL